MTQLVSLFILLVTLVPMLFIALILSPFGLADDVAHGYEGWINGICQCDEPMSKENTNG